MRTSRRKWNLNLLPTRERRLQNEYLVPELPKAQQFGLDMELLERLKALLM
jgi:hypothetical protein